ncbi:hypothetical protein [Pseudomonas kitaguniensis]|uniref:hypothetical protein n=1 Tax=Pseudomonas kitaguniensis TaxID=2607908 RepID=UPI003D0296A6
MSGTIQSSDYVPGVSGWKFNTLTGEFEIHTSTSTSIPEPQPITVTAGEWSEPELPSNALERYAFFGAEIQNIPLDYRESAEISTSDHSCCPGDYADVRTTLTYIRRETPSEVAARIKRGSASAMMDGLVGGGFSIYHDGQLRVRLGSSQKPSPFVVADGKVYLREGLIDKGSVSHFTVSPQYSVKVQRGADGAACFAGYGIQSGPLSKIIVKASCVEILPGGMVRITEAPAKP